MKIRGPVADIVNMRNANDKRKVNIDRLREAKIRPGDIIPDDIEKIEKEMKEMSEKSQIEKETVKKPKRGTKRIYDPEKEWEIEKIIDEKKRGEETMYKVKWAEWNNRYNSWRPESELKETAPITLNEWKRKRKATTS